MEDSSSPFFLSVWPRSWRTGRSRRHHWAPAYRTGRTNRRHAAWHIVPAPCHAVPRGTVRTPCRLQRVDAVPQRVHSASVPPCPIAPPAPVTRKRSGTVPRLCRSKGMPAALAFAHLARSALRRFSPQCRHKVRSGAGLAFPHLGHMPWVNPVGGNAFITPPPACTFFLRIFVWHVPPFRGCGPGEGRPADLWHLWPAGHPRGQAV